MISVEVTIMITSVFPGFLDLETPARYSGKILILEEIDRYSRTAVQNDPQHGRPVYYSKSRRL
jgi:hypothetical protein